MDTITCPNCNQELDRVYAARSVELQKGIDGSDNWVEKNVFSSAVSCPHCHMEFDESFVDDLGIEGY